MLKSLYLLAAAGCCLLPVPLAAQSSPSAEGPAPVVWLGGSFSSFNPDYGCSNNSPFSCWKNHVMGISPYAITKSILFNRVRAEGQARFLLWHGPSSLTESSYMAGPNIELARLGEFSFNAKFLIGIGRIHIPSPQVGSGSYIAYAPGGAVNYRWSRHVSLRGDYEYQIWPSFGGRSGKHGLTPNGLSLGMSYAIF